MKIHETSKILITVSEFPSLPEGPIRTLEMSCCEKKRITTIHLTNVTCIQVALAHQSATHEFLPCPTSQCWWFHELNLQTTHQQNPPSISHHTLSPSKIGLNNERFPCFTKLLFAWCLISFHFWHSKNLRIFRCLISVKLFFLLPGVFRFLGMCGPKKNKQNNNTP